MSLFQIIQKLIKTNKLLKEIKTLSREKELIEAIEKAQEVIHNWDYEPNWKKWLFFNIWRRESYQSLIQKITRWRSLVKKSNKFIQQAKAIEESFMNDPERSGILSMALVFYQESLKIVENYDTRIKLNKCNQIITNCQEYFELVNKSKEYAEQLQFQQAVERIKEAKTFFDTSSLQQLNIIYDNKVKEEKAYIETLNKVKKIAQNGSFEYALNLLSQTWDSFPRSDGKILINKLKHIIQGNELYQIGRNAEKNGDYLLAITKYQESANLLPKVQDIKTRLAIIFIKTEQFEIAQSILASLEGEQCQYLKGLIYAKQKNWNQAQSQWLKISNPVINEQLEQLEICRESEKYKYLKNIKNAVKSEQLILANNLSLEYLQTFGLEEDVQYNLVNHIRPKIFKEAWQNSDWDLLAEQSIQKWINEYDASALHNWAIACYHRALGNVSNLTEMFIAWMMILVNLEKDPALKNIPWLLGADPDIQFLSEQILLLLESTLENIKETNPQEYLSLKDLFRCDVATWRLLQNSRLSLVTYQQYVLTPNLLNKQLINLLEQPTLPRTLCATLYTEWSQVVAACLEGDFKRAIQIQVNRQPQNELERFAKTYTDYQLASYFLKEFQWKKAFSYIQNSKLFLVTESDWFNQLDLLCQNQRNEIEDFPEHLSFSKAWYELLDTKESRRYYIDYKVRELSNKLAEEELSLTEAVRQLQAFKEIDSQNSLVFDLLQKINSIEESNRVFSLIKQGKIEEAVRIASKSSNSNLRYHLANLFMEIIKDRGSVMSYSEHQNLVIWIKKLCPELF